MIRVYFWAEFANSVFTSLCFDLFFHVDYIYIDLNSDLLQFIFLCFLFFFFPRDLDEVYSIGHLALVSNCTNFWSTGITWFRWSSWYPKPWSFPRAYFFTSNLKVQVELLFKKKDARRTVTSVLHSLSSKLMTPLISTFTEKAYSMKLRKSRLVLKFWLPLLSYLKGCHFSKVPESVII